MPMMQPWMMLVTLLMSEVNLNLMKNKGPLEPLDAVFISPFKPSKSPLKPSCQPFLSGRYEDSHAHVLGPVVTVRTSAI